MESSYLHSTFNLLEVTYAYFFKSKSAEVDESVSIIDEFPNELIDHIFSYLSFKEMLTASSVCREWRQIAGASFITHHKFKELSPSSPPPDWALALAEENGLISLLQILYGSPPLQSSSFPLIEGDTSCKTAIDRDLCVLIGRTAVHVYNWRTGAYLHSFKNDRYPYVSNGSRYTHSIEVTDRENAAFDLDNGMLALTYKIKTTTSKNIFGFTYDPIKLEFWGAEVINLRTKSITTLSKKLDKESMQIATQDGLVATSRYEEIEMRKVEMNVPVIHLKIKGRAQQMKFGEDIFLAQDAATIKIWSIHNWECVKEVQSGRLYGSINYAIHPLVKLNEIKNQEGEEKEKVESYIILEKNSSIKITVFRNHYRYLPAFNLTAKIWPSNEIELRKSTKN